MITVGVDLAAEPTKTALAVVAWTPSGAELRSLQVDVADGLIIETAASAAKIGIDCPLGWPVDFVAFVTRHQRGAVRPDEANSIAARQSLALRRTDLAVRAGYGLLPLSVSTDRIGRAAMRAAGLLSALAGGGTPLDRTGAGLVVEVYPAAALTLWKHHARRYKGRANHPARARLVEDFLGQTGWLAVTEADREVCERSDDAFDAVVAALNARAAALGLVTAPATPAELEAARTEGWIAIPTCTLAELDPRRDC